MNKSEERKVKAGFIIGGGFLSAFQLHKWGLGWILSLTLGFIFTIALWIGITWTTRKVFGKH